MHIAHLEEQKVIGVEELAKRVGLKRRQIGQLARNGKIPGAIRPDGYHYVYSLTPELLDWIEWKRRQVERRKHQKVPKQGEYGSHHNPRVAPEFRYLESPRGRT